MLLREILADVPRIQTNVVKRPHQWPTWWIKRTFQTFAAFRDSIGDGATTSNVGHVVLASCRRLGQELGRRGVAA